MAVDGKWEIVINSQLGAQKAQLDLKTDGASLSGSQQAAQGSGPLENGKVDGNNLSWSAKITSPMPMTLDFNGTVDGDKVTFVENLNYQGTALAITYTGQIVSADEIKFKRDVGGQGGEEFTAARQK